MVDFKTKATRQDFAVNENPQPGDRVHVEGWLAARVFMYVKTSIHGTHTVMACASGRRYMTQNTLLHLANDTRTLQMRAAQEKQ